MLLHAELDDLLHSRAGLATIAQKITNPDVTHQGRVIDFARVEVDTGTEGAP